MDLRHLAVIFSAGAQAAAAKDPALAEVLREMRDTAIFLHTQPEDEFEADYNELLSRRP